MNVFDYALKMEEDGKALYEKLAAESSHSGLTKIFNDLAADEQKHYEIFRRLKEKQTPGKMVDSKALEGAKMLFAEMQTDDASMAQLKSDLEAYHYAMRAEKESAALYRDAASKESSDEIKELLLRIAREEDKHLNILENIYDFVNEPKQAMVWAESTNRDEF
jgi:rubrerythrin